MNTNRHRSIHNISVAYGSTVLAKVISDPTYRFSGHEVPVLEVCYDPPVYEVKYSAKFTYLPYALQNKNENYVLS